MEAKAVDVDTIFRYFTACPEDLPTLLLDLRPNKDFKKRHVNQAYNVRLSANGKALLVSPRVCKTRVCSARYRVVLSCVQDYSKATYKMAWSKDCWCDCGLR